MLINLQFNFYDFFIFFINTIIIMAPRLPIKIIGKKIVRFTEKRNPYKKYKAAKWTWSTVFRYINSIKNSNKKFIKSASVKFGININTLNHKYKIYCNNKSHKFNEENRGGINKLLSYDKEKKLYNQIFNKFINKNKPLTNKIIIQLALQYATNGKKNISNSWCTMFKKRWNLSTQKIRASKIATVVPTTADIYDFLNKYKEYKRTI